MRVFTKSWSIWLPINLDQAWNFFSRPENLKLITPPDMQFKLLSELLNTEMYEGMFIHYSVKPILGIEVNWATEITHIKPLQYFVDEQRSGPYKIWHHEHHFKLKGNGVQMDDLLHYALPFGFIGQMVNEAFISDKIDSIFAYRKQELKTRFV
ncbi:MAG: SRPBCC family protein [Saprospiraceae bacterium]